MCLSEIFIVKFKWEDICKVISILLWCIENNPVNGRSVVSDSLWPHGLYSPWNSPGQNTGVGSYSLLQDIFPTQELNPGLPHCRQILSQLSHEGSPRILEWIAYPFSRGSSQPRNRTRESLQDCRWLFTNWATREALINANYLYNCNLIAILRTCTVLNSGSEPFQTQCHKDEYQASDTHRLPKTKKQKKQETLPINTGERKGK